MSDLEDAKRLCQRATTRWLSLKAKVGLGLWVAGRSFRVQRDSGSLPTPSSSRRVTYCHFILGAAGLPFGSKVASATADDVLVVACLCSTAPGDLLSFTPRLDSQNGSVLHGACSAWRFAVRAEQAA